MVAGNSINESTAGITGFTGTAFVGTPVTQYNVLTGSSTSSTLNNVAPSATSGVPLISQGSSSQPVFGTAVVDGGGTGNTTFTAYSVINAGTTATGAFQNVSGVGSSGQALTSNGASALPTWQNLGAGGGSSFYLSVGPGGATLTDATTYYFAPSITIITFTADNNACRFYMPRAGTINTVYGNLNVAGTLGSTENATLALRLNNTTNSNITTTLKFNAVNTAFNTTSLGLSVSAGDFVEAILISPTWATNPSLVTVNLTFILT